MYWRDIGYLCKPVTELDSTRRPKKVSYEKREVDCNEIGIKRQEFYQAAIAGIKPELCVEIRKAEYDKEKYFEYDDILYRIVRTYPVKNECLELICTTQVRDES